MPSWVFFLAVARVYMASRVPQAVRNAEVAGVLYEIADLMEMEGREDRFKPIAYRRAGRGIEALPEDIEELWRRGGVVRLRGIPGVGQAIAEKIDQYLREGRIDALEEYRTRVPAGLARVMSIPGVGPKTASVLWQKLGVTSVEDLRRVAETGQLRRLKGFGERSEQKILRGIQLVTEGERRTLLAFAWPVAEEVVAYLREHAPVEALSVGGSLRRMKETVGDLDVLCVSSDPAATARAFTSMPWVRQVVLAGELKATVILGPDRSGLQVDLRVFEPRSWGAGLQYFTGNKDHNIHLRNMAGDRGWKLNEYGLFEGERQVAGATEEEVYSALGLPWIPPEMREEEGEIEAAARGELPRLVEPTEVRGDLHVHTNRSDGIDSLEAMVEAAVAKGYEYVGISEHSPSLVIANGLSVDEVRIHRARIRALNEMYAGRITVLMGTECDILEGGALDYPDEVLKDFDYVIAAVHSKFTLPEKDQTRRVVTAVSNPYVSILAHPTARLIGKREPIAIDLEAVMEAAAKSGTAIEVNAFPDRMDLNGAQARRAKRLGCTLAVDTDSHSRAHLDFMRYGVGSARRGWLGPEDIVNCWTLDRVRGFLR